MFLHTHITGAIKTEIKQEPLTEEQRVTQRILRSSHSRGSSSSSPAAPDVSPSAIPVNTPPSSAGENIFIGNVFLKTEFGRNTFFGEILTSFCFY